MARKAPDREAWEITDEDPWLQALLWFNVAFLALLFLVQAWQASRPTGKKEEEGGPTAWDWLIGSSDGGGTPFLL